MIGIMIMIMDMIMAMIMIKMTLMTLTMIVTFGEERGTEYSSRMRTRLPADNWQAVM